MTALPFSNRVTYFAETNHRARAVPFGIKRADRLSHMYVIGQTGTGKSTLLETMCRQDIEHGEGFALIDPHGDLVERVAAFGRELRPDDVIYLNVPDPSQPYGYNPLRRVSQERRPLAASGLLEVFKKRWSDSWGVRMEHILRHAIITLLDQPDVSLPDLLRLLTDEGFRDRCFRHLTNEQVRSFWTDEYALLSARQRTEAIAPIQNKVGAFLADPRVRRVVTGADEPILLRRMMDEGKILLVNLAKGTIGEDSASLLGALLVTTLGLAAFSRADTPEDGRRPFFVYTRISQMRCRRGDLWMRIVYTYQDVIISLVLSTWLIQRVNREGTLFSSISIVV